MRTYLASACYYIRVLILLYLSARLAFGKHRATRKDCTRPQTTM
jgi:hypothetical protein